MSNQFFSPEGDIENYYVDEYWLIDQYVGNELWVWGRGVYGKLGTNDTFNRSTPTTTFAGGNDWKQVSSGNFHMAAIKTDGTLWVWGRGVNGRLGNNDNTNNKLTPVTTFAGGNNWKQVDCRGDSTIAIKTDGTLWVWGFNGNARLGTNDANDRSTPVTTFAGGSNWKQVTSGSSRFAAIKTDGTLWTWGINTNAQLGTNDSNDRSTPVTTFAGGSDWKQVSIDIDISIASKTDGTLWTWGRNTYGRLGTNDPTNITKSTPVTTFAGGTNWKQVSCTFSVVSTIKTDGTLWIWGRGTNGILGNNTSFGSILTPITTFAGGTNWKQVSCGNFHNAAIKTDGTLWTWGINDVLNSPTLGTNDTNNKLTPVTTFAGGTDWKLVHAGASSSSAIKSGTTPELPLS